MKKVWLGAGSFILFGWLAMPVQAQVCAGDCDGGGDVGISELITCVNISLGNAQLSSCTACDPGGDDDVGINELILAVSASLCGCPGGLCTTPPTPTPGGEAICGDGTRNAAEGEDCDDGNNFGGDGCAANCTTETSLVGTFDEAKTKAVVQTAGLQIPVLPTGGQTFRAGKARNEVVRGPGGVVLFQSGEIPVVIKASELHFDPVKVSTVACACIRPFERPELFGPGNAAAGVIGCGDAGLTDINYRVIQDHNTNPGDEFNACNESQGGAPDDAECDNESEPIAVPGNPSATGIVSRACKEQSGDERCNDASRFLHPGTCNSPRILVRSGGPAPRGSAFMVNNTAISTLMDSAACCQPGDNCAGSACVADYGPDCLACTDDDLNQTAPNALPTTTGVAEAAVYDLNDGELANQGAVCTADADKLVLTIDADNGPNGCGGGGTEGQGCIARVEGSRVDCDLLQGENPEQGLRGASLVVAFPSIDAALIKDDVTTTTFFNK